MSKNGFTLLELLVVIAIIGSLAAMLLPNYMSARERARDVQRKSDIKQFKNALELYKLDQNPPLYPNAIFSFPSVGGQWDNGGSPPTIYTRSFPGDPVTGQPYGYAPSADQLSYVLCACLENKADSDGVTGTCKGTSCHVYELHEP